MAAWICLMMSPRAPSSRKGCCQPSVSLHVVGDTRSASRSPSRCSRRATSVDASMNPGRPPPCTATSLPWARRSSSRSSDVKRFWVISLACARWTSTARRGPSSSVASSCAPPQALRDVRAIEADLAPLAIDAPHDHVRVGVARVVVVDRRPFELAPEVALHSGHQALDVVGEVEFRGVLRRHDEPELMPLAGPGLLERLDARRPRGRVEPALRAVLLDPVALDVPQVQ